MMYVNRVIFEALLNDQGTQKFILSWSGILEMTMYSISQGEKLC